MFSGRFIDFFGEFVEIIFGGFFFELYLLSENKNVCINFTSRRVKPISPLIHFFTN